MTGKELALFGKVWIQKRTFRMDFSTWIDCCKESSEEEKVDFYVCNFKDS